MNNNVMWSGKEWITDSYPPKISQDVTEFMSVEENERRQGRTKELSLYLCVDGKRLFGISEQS